MEVTETLQFPTAQYCLTGNHEISLALNLEKGMSLIKVFLLSETLPLSGARSLPYERVQSYFKL